MGQRHIRNLKSLGMEQIAVCDTSPASLSKITSEQNVKGYTDFEAAIEASLPGAVLVCTPPYLHLPQALTAINAGAHVFVEKPLSHSLEGVDELIQQSQARRRVVQVGYNWRFHRGLQKVKALVESGTIGRVLWSRAEVGQYLPDWRPQQDYRLNYTGHRDLGGGIILDSSHEIDYLRWMFGEVEQVYCLAGVLSDLDVDAEDTASMVLRFAVGCVGEIHLDFVQRVRSRNCKIVGTEGTIYWDNLDESIRLYTTKTNEWNTFVLPIDPNDKYLSEIEFFLESLDMEQELDADVRSARRTLEISLAALESARTQCAVAC